ncbi:MAG: bifunctional 4-hydroxy-2-oxoglutarate aldolase/2-dehydro-3-deoxy-phosphogluconate aldolase [Alphaproteobacteria bacterium]|jgi:2-dehydro-3-deoxyphosphogluconate aldolase/(4S)-4-hydroxy-2-oxoglutarate aldolase|nr:bifunctional 4-hydroxy-2-oxoglutarate aldolase/2-dehydro-3-deoxy-phosphogluconate aldolase [Alphaproteobacteria bacterium]
MSVIEKIKNHKIVGVFREDPQLIADTLKASFQGGLRVMELTFSIADVCTHIEATKAKHGEAIIGAGTVLNPQDAANAIKAGADFIVSPIFITAVNKVCRDNNISYIPGTMTLQEMFHAYNEGCQNLKLFPANNFSASYLKTALSLFPHYSIMPTGGVNASNAGEWLEAGAFAVGIGSEINKLAVKKDFDGIEHMFKTLAGVANV